MAESIETAPIEEKAGFWQRNKWFFIGFVAMTLGLLIGWAVIRYIGAPYTYHGTVIQSPQLTPNFSLTGEGGKVVNLRDFRGKAVLLYFGYTFCPDVCPATMVELKEAVEKLGREADDVQVIMISVDPDRDTPEKLAEYVSHFNPSFIGLTGSDDEVGAVATQYGIFYEKHEGTVATGYLIDHTASVVVIDPDGYLRIVYPFGTPGEDIAEDLRHLVN